MLKTLRNKFSCFGDLEAVFNNKTFDTNTKNHETTRTDTKTNSNPASGETQENTEDGVDTLEANSYQLQLAMKRDYIGIFRFCTKPNFKREITNIEEIDDTTQQADDELFEQFYTPDEKKSEKLYTDYDIYDDGDPLDMLIRWADVNMEMEDDDSLILEPYHIVDEDGNIIEEFLEKKPKEKDDVKELPVPSEIETHIGKDCIENRNINEEKTTECNGDECRTITNDPTEVIEESQRPIVGFETIADERIKTGNTHEVPDDSDVKDASDTLTDV